MVGFTRDLAKKNYITVQIKKSPDDATCLVGRDVYVHNDGKRSAVYRIKQADSLGEGKYRLHIGDHTLIRSYISDNDLEKGFVYDIAARQPFYIPLSLEARLGMTGTMP